jgi:hypothetical protein
MQTQAREHLIRELHDALASGALAHCGRVEISDGMTVDAERMARIVLVELEYVARGTPGACLAAGYERVLYDDMLRLLTLARPAGARVTAAPVKPDSPECHPGLSRLWGH